MSQPGNGGPHDAARLNARIGARLLGGAVARIQLSPTISVEVSEPDPSKINPAVKASMQAFVGSLHALSQHRESIDQLLGMISQLDQVVQGLTHTVDYLVRRVALLEERGVMALPADEHADMAAVHRENIASLATNLRTKLAEQRAAMPES